MESAGPAVAGAYWITQYDQSAELTFYGLTPGRVYDLGIFASTTDGNIGEGRYSVGDVQTILDAYNNVDQWALLEGLIADENGVLVPTVEAANGSHRAAINVIELTAVPEPVTAFVMTALALAGLATRRRPVG